MLQSYVTVQHTDGQKQQCIASTWLEIVGKWKHWSAVKLTSNAVSSDISHKHSVYLKGTVHTLSQSLETHSYITYCGHRFRTSVGFSLSGIYLVPPDHV